MKPEHAEAFRELREWKRKYNSMVAVMLLGFTDNQDVVYFLTEGDLESGTIECVGVSKPVTFDPKREGEG